MDKEDVRGLMMELCAVGTDFDQMKVEELHKACAILEHMTSFKARDIIKSAGTRPVLQVYMSDGWCTDIRAQDTSFVGKVRTGLVWQLS